MIKIILTGFLNIFVIIKYKYNIKGYSFSERIQISITKKFFNSITSECFRLLQERVNLIIILLKNCT